MAKHADASHEEVSKPDTAEETSSAATELDADDAEDYDDAVDADVDDDPKDVAAEARPMSSVRLATALGVVAVVASTALAGWLGFREYQALRAQQQCELLVQVGRQGAVNLTTIDWQHADADIQRILDSATDTFYDDFSKRSKPFADVVKKAQSKTVGTVTEAGLESQSSDEAQVLVAISVRTSIVGATEEEPRHWRMRISVKRVGDEAKVSNVAFVQ
ncbi:MAG: Mce protein [Mycobacterium sp.]|uniref:Mce protein n=1 Tax=Mycobacterium sp. TaxID=1785 RepID=UPI003BAF4373